MKVKLTIVHHRSIHNWDPKEVGFQWELDFGFALMRSTKRPSGYKTQRSARIHARHFASQLGISIDGDV